jgi:hypothetical protein
MADFLVGSRLDTGEQAADDTVRGLRSDKLVDQAHTIAVRLGREVSRQRLLTSCSAGQ